MKQLDVVVSPPAFLWDPYLTLTYEIFDLDHVDLPKSNGSRDINFYLVIFGPMNYFLVTDRRTDGHTDGRKATHKSPPCISTGGLKNEMLPIWTTPSGIIFTMTWTLCIQ